MKKNILISISLLLINISIGQSIGLKIKDIPIQWKSLPSNNLKSNKTQFPLHLNSKTKSIAFISPYKYADQLGFVCKWELKMDERSKNQVRFRLGSYDYVNKLEGK